MAMGNCRHCGAGRIASDAPICRECGGWRPNPGFCARTGVVTTRLVALLMLAGGLGFGALMCLADQPGLSIYAVPFVCGGGPLLFRSLIRPYGQVPSVE